MQVKESRLRQPRRSIYAALGLAVLCAAGLVVTASAMSTSSSVVEVSNSVEDGSGATPVLGGIQLSDAPATCSAAQLAERAAQIELLEQEQAAELRVIATITDGSLDDKLVAIRDRAEIILGRIQQIDDRCPIDRGDTEPADPADPADPAEPADPADPVPIDEVGAPEVAPEVAPAPEVDGGDVDARELAQLAISCDEPDLSTVDAAAAARAEQELANNEAQLNGRLAADFPRFSARVAREDDPTRAAGEYAQLAENLAGTLEARRVAILERAGLEGAAAVAATCVVVETDA